MFFQEDLFGLVLGQIGDFGDNQKLLDEGESFFFPFIHDILLCPASQNSLQEQHSNLSFNFILLRRRLFVQFLFGDALFPVDDIHVFIVSVVGGGRTGYHISQCLDIVAHSFVLLFLGLRLPLNILLCYL